MPKRLTQFLKSLKDQGVTRIFPQPLRDESGNIFLLGVAAILILFMTTMLIIDAGKVTRLKLASQTVTDSAAYTGSTVHAQALNQIAFANIAKRSIVGITAGYESIYRLLGVTTLAADAACVAFQVVCNLSARLSKAAAVETGKHTLFKVNLRLSYKKDLEAIDNVQRYYEVVTPWWIWSEMVARAIGNGARAASSYPVPEYDSGGHNVRKYGNLAGLKKGRTAPYLKLPIKHFKSTRSFGKKKGMYEGLRNDDYADNGIFLFDCINFFSGIGEGCMNVYFYVAQAQDEVLMPFAVAAHPNFQVTDFLRFLSIDFAADLVDSILSGIIPQYSSGYDEVMSVFKDYGQPYVIDEGLRNRWHEALSLTAFTYHSAPELGEVEPERYQLTVRDRLSLRSHYVVKGLWNIATSEVVYTGKEKPDLWHTRWTARMRPVDLYPASSSRPRGKLSDINTMLSTVYPYMIYSTKISGIALPDKLPFFNHVVTPSGPTKEDQKSLSKWSKAVGIKTTQGMFK